LMSTLHKILSDVFNLFYPNQEKEEQELRSWIEIMLLFLGISLLVYIITVTSI
jgi:heme/copper-type cytochrome/quinol oxidase subunit 2